MEIVTHSGPRLRMLMVFSTAVSGCLNCKMHFCCSLLSLQKTRLLDLPLSENSLITLVIVKCPFCIVKIGSLLLLFCVFGSTFSIFVLQKSTVCRNGHCVLSKYKNIRIPLCLLLDWVYLFHMLNKLCWTPAVQGLHGVTPKGSMDRTGKREAHEVGYEKCHILIGRMGPLHPPKEDEVICHTDPFIVISLQLK